MGTKDTGKDYYAELYNPAETREITAYGKTMTVYFRRITAGERVKVNAGVQFVTRGAEGTESTVKWDEFLKRQQLMVMFSNVKEDGKTRVFRNEQEVADLDSAIFDALYKHAEEINKEDSNEGKDLSGT